MGTETVSLGSGRIAVSTFAQEATGMRGIMFRDSGKTHKVGEPTGEPAGLLEPKEGDVYICCGNRESALVLLEAAAKVVAGFSQ